MSRAKGEGQNRAWVYILQVIHMQKPRGEETIIHSPDKRIKPEVSHHKRYRFILLSH